MGAGPPDTRTRPRHHKGLCPLIGGRHLLLHAHEGRADGKDHRGGMQGPGPAPGNGLCHLPGEVHGHLVSVGVFCASRQLAVPLGLRWSCWTAISGVCLWHLHLLLWLWLAWGAATHSTHSPPADTPPSLAGPLSHKAHSSPLALPSFCCSSPRLTSSRFYPSFFPFSGPDSQSVSSFFIFLSLCYPDSITHTRSWLLDCSPSHHNSLFLKSLETL